MKSKQKTFLIEQVIYHLNYIKLPKISYHQNLLELTKYQNLH